MSLSPTTKSSKPCFPRRKSKRYPIVLFHRRFAKVVPVDRLIKGKYIDHLEFLQWMKRYYDLHAHSADYNPLERRNGKQVSNATADGQKKPGSCQSQFEEANPPPPSTPRISPCIAWQCPTPRTHCCQSHFRSSAV